jgi:2-phospho-L-lactate guanylyltransferase (CobY/MobA/RfbA family)
MPAGVDFVLHYGPGSFVAHLEEVNLRGLPHHVLHDDDLALDLDTADDLRELERRNKETT